MFYGNRIFCSSSLCDSWSIGANGVKDAALTLIHDNDKDVRSSILSNVGELGNGSLVPELEKVLNDPSQRLVLDAIEKEL